MPEVYQDIVATPILRDSAEADIVARLMEYTEPIHNPWRKEYLDRVVAECYNFKELNQWSSPDVQLLALADTPALAVDRINRGLDTIKGIRENTGNKRKTVKRGLGDDRIAEILDKVTDYVEYHGDFESVNSEVFESMLDTGLGVAKVGYDASAQGGEGEIWIEKVEIEDFGYSKHKDKTLKDISWAWHCQVMEWEDAMLINPDRAPELKTLKSTLQSEWEKIKGSYSGGNLVANDYGVASVGQPAYAYENQVYVYEFWIKRRVPKSKVSFTQTLQVPGPDGNPIDMPVPGIRKESIDYQPTEGEKIVAKYVEVTWEQYIVASGPNRKNGILLKQATADDHPFVGMCAERRKSGMPRGYIETVIPHQKRINIAWSQKVAYNNKSIKSPIVLKNVVNIDKIIKQSAIGSIINLTGTEEIVNYAVPMQSNLQAIEEGAVARQDMDFAAGATEPPLRGITEPGSSGIKLSLQQSAAVTPLNKYTKAERNYIITLGRKVLRLIIEKFTPEKMQRILGQEFERLAGIQVDPVTGQPTAPPLELPIQPDVAQYDVVVSDQALSDFNKQQSFNAVETLVGGGVPMDDEFRIKNAPIRNTDEALISNRKARQDILRQLLAENQMLKDELGQKQESGRGGNQRRNAQTGRSAPQIQQSMLGGTSPFRP